MQQRPSWEPRSREQHAVERPRPDAAGGDAVVAAEAEAAVAVVVAAGDGAAEVVDAVAVAGAGAGAGRMPQPANRRLGLDSDSTAYGECLAVRHSGNMQPTRGGRQRTRTREAAAAGSVGDVGPEAAAGEAVAVVAGAGEDGDIPWVVDS